MMCESIQEVIPQLIRRELNGYDRIAVINHLQQCPECLTEYKNYLNMYYTIDWEVVTKAMPSLSLDLSKSHTGPIQKSTGGYRFFRTKSFYTAAALLILGISVLLTMSKTDQTQKANTVQNPSIRPGLTETRTLKTEAREYITSRQINTIFSQKKVPVSFLEQHLLALQNKGIDRFTISQVLTRVSLKNSSGFQDIGHKSLPVMDCLNKIQAVKKYKSQLTFSELVSFVNTIENGGV